MSVTAAIRQMIASGLTFEQALIAAEAFETASKPTRTARQERNARYYQSKASEKRLNASETSYSDDQDAPPVPPFLDKEKSPTPPKEIKLSPLTPHVTPAVREIGASFDQFWAAFPNRVGKRDAEKAFAKAVTRSTFDEIMAGLARYASKADDRPWCNPSTFLNQNRWEDQPANVVPLRRNEPPPRRRTAADAMAESARTNGQSTRDAMKRIFGMQDDEQPDQTSDFGDAGGFPLIEHRS